MLDALRAANTQLSPDPHPLLSDELLKIKHPLQRESSDSAPDGAPPVDVKEEAPATDIVDSVGSLSVAENGRTKFYGNSANSYVRESTPLLP